MVFYRWTIGIDGFSIRDDVFSMVFYRRTIGIDGFFAVEPLVSIVFSNGYLPWKHWSRWFFNGLEKASDGHQWFTEKRLFIVNMAPVSEI